MGILTMLGLDRNAEIEQLRTELRESYVARREFADTITILHAAGAGSVGKPNCEIRRLQRVVEDRNCEIEKLRGGKEAEFIPPKGDSFYCMAVEDDWGVYGQGFKRVAICSTKEFADMVASALNAAVAVRHI